MNDTIVNETKNIIEKGISYAVAMAIPARAVEAAGGVLVTLSDLGIVGTYSITPCVFGIICHYTIHGQEFTSVFGCKAPDVDNLMVGIKVSKEHSGSFKAKTVAGKDAFGCPVYYREVKKGDKTLKYFCIEEESDNWSVVKYTDKGEINISVETQNFAYVRKYIISDDIPMTVLMEVWGDNE